MTTSLMFTGHLFPILTSFINQLKHDSEMISVFVFCFFPIVIFAFQDPIWNATLPLAVVSTHDFDPFLKFSYL